MNPKSMLLNGAAQHLFKIGLTSPVLRGRNRLSIVTFHRVLCNADREGYPFPNLVVTPDELDSHLTYFTEHFDCGSLSTQYQRYLRDDVTARPLLAITFDDAQHDNYLNARPALAKHNLKVSFFVPVAAVERQELLWHDRLGFAILTLLKHGQNGREKLLRILAETGISANITGTLTSNVVRASKDLSLEARLSLVETLVKASGDTKIPAFARLMNFEELAELVADGHEIGSHSMTHCMMTECADSALNYEVAESRRVLQDRLGQSIETFCYPNGDSDARTAHAVAQAGYLCAVTTNWGCNGQEADHFQLRRYDMVAKRVQDSRGKFMPALLAFRMSGFYPGLG